MLQCPCKTLTSDGRLGSKLATLCGIWRLQHLGRCRSVRCDAETDAGMQGDLLGLGRWWSYPWLSATRRQQHQRQLLFMFVPTQMFGGRCCLELLSLGADTLIIQTIMDLIESDWAEMSHGQLKFVEIWRDRCCCRDNNGGAAAIKPW